MLTNEGRKIIENTVCLICFSLCKAEINYFITEYNVIIRLNSNPICPCYQLNERKRGRKTGGGWMVTMVLDQAEEGAQI